MECEKFKMDIYYLTIKEYEKISDITTLENHLTNCENCWEYYSNIYKLHSKLLISAKKGGTRKEKMQKIFQDLMSVKKEGINYIINRELKETIRYSKELIQQNKPQEAYEYLKEVYDLDPKNKKVKDLINQIIVQNFEIKLGGIGQKFSFSKIGAISISSVIHKPGELILKWFGKIISQSLIKKEYIRKPDSAFQMEVVLKPKKIDENELAYVEILNELGRGKIKIRFK